MAWLLRWLIRNPVRGAVLAGILVAVLTGYISFPREKTVSKTVSDWLPANAVTSATQRNELLSALEAFDAGAPGDLASVSEKEFRALGLQQAYAFLEPGDSTREFVVRYAGRLAGNSTLFVAERDIAAAPWWSPDRWAYKALGAEVDQAGNILRLTYERDLTGLFAVLLLDIVVGAVYGTVIGLILAVLGLEGIDRKHQPKLPKPLQIPAPHARQGFRV